MMKCRRNDAHLVPDTERTFEVPKATQDHFGIGQSNYWYIQNNAQAHDYETQLIQYINEHRQLSNDTI